MKMQPDFRILGPERADDLRQHVARLRVGGRNRQRAAIGLAQLRRRAANILHFAQDAAGARNDFLARRGGAGQRAALTLEQLKPQLFFQQFELAAHARLRGVQLPCGCRDVQPVFMDGHEIAQLLEFHRPALCLWSWALAYKVIAHHE